MLYVFCKSKLACSYLCCVVFSVIFCNNRAFGQTSPLLGEILKIRDSLDAVNRNWAPEKAYLKFDKSYYTVGDTLWFKAWLINEPSYMLSAKSGLLHIDIANDSNRVIKEYMMPINAGISWGNIYLDEKNFKEGSYLLSAYTNWMRNFGEAGIFHKKIQIAGVQENAWLINKSINTQEFNNGSTEHVKLRLTDMDKQPIANTNLRLQVMTGKKVLSKKILPTDRDGLLDMNLGVPEKVSNVTIIIEDDQKNKKAVIPIALNRIENTDIQFLPEGGNMVLGINAHIGFKAIGEDGRGVDISGDIIDQDQKLITPLRTFHNGMGSFDLLPEAGKIYAARVTIADGETKIVPLPQAKEIGTSLHIKNLISDDSLEVTVKAKSTGGQRNSYLLIGKARGVICYAAVINLLKNSEMQMKVAKSLFPSGITHFLLLTQDQQPLNERLVYVDHQDNLSIEIKPDRNKCTTKDSVGIHLAICDHSGNPVAGNFSMAVTDDAFVKTDSLYNILTDVLLTSELKGYVESPGYYLKKNKEAWVALDNLLLTQGWVSYAPVNTTMHYAPEQEFAVNGKVENVFNKPIKGTHVILFSKSPVILMDTVTDNAGNFSFNHFPRLDTPIFILKAVNKKGKSFNVNININRPSRPAFDLTTMPLQTPWYINSDSTLLHYVKNSIGFQKDQEYIPDGRHHLKEVVITGKKTVKDSKNLNGPGNADIVLNEKDMEAAGKKSLLQLLQETLKDLRERDLKDGPKWHFIQDAGDSLPVVSGVAASLTHQWFFINGKPVKFFVDGLSVSNIFPPSIYELLSQTGAYITMTEYLKSHSAEDIKGIEVMSSTKYAMKYIPVEWQLRDIRPWDISFVEITTRGGHGPAIGNTPGMYLYKPLPISWPAQFYKPKYAVNDTVNRPDHRSTIDWEPNIMTNTDGKAAIWFYAGYRPSTYTMIIEGTDFNGNFGYKLQKLIIKDQPGMPKSK